jgi:methylthioribose-1-phosphate isomerase
MIRTITWQDGLVRLIDQRKLPCKTEFIECHTHQEVAEAIRTLAVRGAPAIGVAGAMALVLAAEKAPQDNRESLLAALKKACQELAATRPTAVNLKWGLDRVLHRAESTPGAVQAIKAALLDEALLIEREDEHMCRRIGGYGAELIPDGASLLTHCNAGSLATAGYGTALGVIRSAHFSGKKIHVFVDETRPLLQGARLTAWELKEEGIPFTLITDNMAGHFMKKGRINLVITGADRIASNGDAANKIGTYSVAVLAMAHAIPFYIAAPYSTVDLSIRSGDDICIEERCGEEVTTIGGVCVAPEGINVANPAFDVTPHHYISALITDKGIITPPYQENLARMLSRQLT